MADSIFTKIIKGEIPSYKVYEDDKTIAFLPLKPTAKGRVLVVPKVQVDKFYDLPDEDYQALMATVKKVAKRVEQTIEAKRVGVQIVGLDVPHVHVHVLAFDTPDEFRQFESEVPEWTSEQLAALAKKLAF